MASTSDSGSTASQKPGQFRPLGPGVWEGFIDSNNVIKGRWAPAAQKMLDESSERLATDEASAKLASERAAFDAARHLGCTAIVIKGSWHPFTVDTANPDVQRPDPMHISVEASASTIWVGRFKVHVYLPPNTQGANLFKTWQTKFTVFVASGFFSQSLSTTGEIPLGFENKLSEPKKKEAAAKPAASTGTKAAPSTGTKAVQSTGAKATPSTGAKATPSTGAKANPSTGAKATPSTGAKATPSTGSKATPSTGAKATPAQPKAGAAWTPPPGATLKKSTDQKTSYYVSKDGKKFWDKTGKEISQPK